ncbi:hypothetical protein G6F70_003892 [Rhizopus microsporus]|nr:hypothetical protein G6F71_003849 [Rhizopus microsporus]KAG1200609.1 hypothetical protein G6F70_003892 [Rhizopus microsporus]KAG1212386.1 hypothetical protein G6F69_003737 [Rhizopus microsporus]
MTFLSEFKEILDEHDIGEKEKSFQPSADKLSFVYQELLSIGFEKVKYMNDTMNEIMFSIKDMSDREHELKVILPSNYPFTAPHIVADTPVPIQSSLSLTTIVRQHQTIIDQHQDLFNCLDDLDKHMRILEPEHPKRSELWRKIALSYHCSLYLEIVDPLLPFNKPQIRLFGSESRVENLRRVWDQAEWNKSLPLHTNLLTIFQLVPNDKQEQEDYTNASDIECAICYSYKLENGETPETICKLCNRGFHSTCLYQWLRSNPNTTQSFNVLFGHCPYCNEVMTINNNVDNFIDYSQ